MSFQQQQHSNGVHYGRGSEAHGMHFYLTVQHRQLQDHDLVSIIIIHLLSFHFFLSFSQ